MTATFVQPNSTSQTGSTYKSAIDAVTAVLAVVGDAFAPHAQASPNMTVALDAGNIVNGTVLTAVAAQNTGTITAPVSNPRFDLVVIDQTTGAASVITGAEAASPVLPSPSAPTQIPIAKISLTTSTTAIAAAAITDLRALFRVPPPPINPLTASLYGAM
jgi:hypothetical protein